MIYLDNCATTRPRKEVINTVKDAMELDYANPSSLHLFAMEVENKLEEARSVLAKSLNVGYDQVYFTSGGTESSNIFHHGLLSQSHEPKTILTTNQEHPATERVLKYYEDRGYDLVYIKSHLDGRLDLDDLEKNIDDQTLLVSVIHVNNQVGAINDLKSICQIVKSKNPKTYIYVDGVQSFGKLDINLKELDIDGFSLSGHKIHGPRGVGALYVSDRSILEPVFLGGGQEQGLRSGTENIPAILGLAKATQIQFENFEKDQAKIRDLRAYLLDLLDEKIDNYRVNTNIEKALSNILNISILGTKGEVLVHFLEEDQIYISTTSACSAKQDMQTNLEKLGLEESITESSIRICLAYDLTKKDIEEFVEKLGQAASRIRKVTERHR